MDKKPRQLKGQPIGGQYAPENRPASSVELDVEASRIAQEHEGWATAAQARIDALDGADAELMDRLLAGAGEVSSGALVEDFARFDGLTGKDVGPEAHLVANLLNAHYRSEHGDNAPYLTYDDGDFADLVMHDRDGVFLTRTVDVDTLTDDPEAWGVEAVLGYARAIDTYFAGLIEHARTSRPPTMSRMRAMVQVDDWRRSTTPVVFEDEDGRAQHAHLRSGRYRDATGTTYAGPEVPDGAEHVRLTMGSGVERFVPFSQLVDLVEEGRIFPR